MKNSNFVIVLYHDLGKTFFEAGRFFKIKQMPLLDTLFAKYCTIDLV